MIEDIEGLVGSFRVPGGRDRHGKPIVQVTIPQDLSSLDKSQLDKSLNYILSIFSDETRRKGLAFVIDAQKSNWRLTRLCVKQLQQGLVEESVTTTVIRPEGFWDKRMDNCTKMNKSGEPVYIPQTRLLKYIELTQLTADLGGSLDYDHASWLQDRQKAERFFRENTETQTEMERVTKILTGARQGLNNAARTMTQTSASYNNTCAMAASLVQEGRNMLDDFGIARITEVIGQDILDTRAKMDKQLGLARTKLLALHQAWGNLLKSLADAKEVSKLEEGVKSVTGWLLTKGEDLLTSHNQVGYDIESAEKLRLEHESVELHCRETYGRYAELLHKMNESTRSGVTIPEDLQAQRDFMDFIVRSIATRLERRRNILISSARFYRLVSEYFQTTSEVYETLVMAPNLEELDKAHATLLQLQESQTNIDLLEEALVREGEKLTDLLAMPVKDALGREISVDYGADILNIREILEMTKARSELFRDNIELQRITLEQASYVYNYENDAAEAIKWLEDLLTVLLKCHSEVGCNVLEIQLQKDDQQLFEETAKGTYDFGFQLLLASLSLRHSCKLCEAPNRILNAKLEQAWQRIQTAAHNQMTRLRVTAVLHRSLNKHSEELIEMTGRVSQIKNGELLRLLQTRESILLEVARMIRLARLLKSRLKEPLFSEHNIGLEYNRSAVDAISDRVAEVTALAEQLDAALCSYHEIGDISDILETSPTQEDWYGSLDKSSSSSGGRSGTSKTLSGGDDDEFVTASECTCTPPSRSSSYHTATEGESSFSSWWQDKPQEINEVVEVMDTQRLRLSKDECTLTRDVATRSSREDILIGQVVGGGRERQSPSMPASPLPTLPSIEDRDVELGGIDGEETPPLSECKNWLELKVVELKPCLTQLADSLELAIEWKQTHNEVIQKIRSKKSPVHELEDQAESVIANQNTSPQVYAAMNESLTAVWENVNHHLDTRARILDLNVAYHRSAEEFFDICRCLEDLTTSEIPIEIDDMQDRLDELKDGLRKCLAALNTALHHGTTLLHILIDLDKQGTLDSRPQHIKIQTQLAKVQVERWMESLHEKRFLIQARIEKAQTELEQCLLLAHITSDLTLLRRLISDRTETVLNTIDHLGDSSSSAQLLAHDHRKTIPEAKDLQEQALKIVRSTEEFAATGHFAGSDAIREAYLLLEQAATYIHHIDQRDSCLERAIEFFDLAQSAVIKLDQLELQLNTGKLGLGQSQISQLHSNISRSLDEVTGEPLERGYALLAEVPGAKGVRRSVEQLENKKINLSVQCTVQKEEECTKANQMYTSFLGKLAALNVYLASMEEYLKGVREMGDNLSSSKEYLQTYRRNLNELQTKGSEINALVSTIPMTVESLDVERGEEIKNKGDTLRETWSRQTLTLERRVRHCLAYGKAQDLGSRLSTELGHTVKAIESWDATTSRQLWTNCQQLKVQFDNVLSNFEKDSREVGTDGGLDLEGARQCLMNISVDINSRMKMTEEALEKSVEVSEERQKDKKLWESNVVESNKTVNWVSKLDSQLYPVLNPELHSARQLSSHVEEKLNAVVPEIKRALQEIQMRIDTAELLLSKGNIKGSNETILLRLKELNTKLLKISADYQILLEKMLTFFNSLAQIEQKIENIQREHQALPLAQNLDEASRQLRDFESHKSAISEMIDMCLIDSGHLLNRVRAQENGNEADVRTIERMVESLRYSWQRLATSRESALVKQEARCRFDRDLHEVHNALDGLASQLTTSKGRYGENLIEARATSAAFGSFEKTINMLEDRIAEFTSSRKELIGGDSGERIERELNALQNKWKLLKDQVLESRRLIDMAEVFFTLVDEAEEWFREGNRVLVSIAQRSTRCQRPEEGQELLNEIELFLKPGEQKQNRRIEEISRIALELWGDEVTSHLRLVKSGSKEILDSFNQVSQNLRGLLGRMNSTQPLAEAMEVETEPVPRKLVDDWHSQITSTSTTKIEQINIRTEQVSPIFLREKERDKKSPSPPLKKVKYVEEIQPVLEAPYFKTPLHNATVQEGNRFTFECRVTGTPVPEIVWEKDGILIENNPDYQVKFNDGLCSLTIEETFGEDSARFTCRAHNEAGSAETSAFFSVREIKSELEMDPPTFIRPLSAITLPEGRTLELKCQTTGVPLPTVQWFVNEECVDNNPHFQITYNNGEALLVKESITSTDQGLYSCLASNPSGTEKTMATVSIQRTEPSELPAFTQELGNVMARAGQKIKLECEAKGTPTPKLAWTKDGKQIKESREVKITTVGGHSTLVVQEAFPKDAGVYSVTASSPAGTAVSTSQVTVKGRLPPESSDTELPSDMEPTKPKVQLQLRDQSVFEGKKVRLDCVIVGVPEPEVIWYHDGQPVKESSDFQLIFHDDRCSLIIQEALLEDAGKYKVVAINSAGEASSECVLSIQPVDKTGERVTRKIESTEVIIEKESKNEEAPKFTLLLSDALVVVGDTLILECTVTGLPMPTVTWSLNNKELQQSHRIHMVQEMDGRCLLKITGVIAEDKGVYTAKAVNQLGEAKCFAHLTVKTPLTLDNITPQAEEKTCPPSFSELFSDVTVSEGGQTKFECIVNGRPTPKVKWMFNDQPVSGKEFLVSTSGNRQVLSLPNVSKSLAGKISCIAENEAGRATCVAVLSISDAAVSLLPSLDEINLDSGVFEMKRSVFMQSSQSSHFSSTTSTTLGGSEPVVRIESSSAKTEVASQKIGDQPAVKVESHKTSEYKNIGGIESKEESTTIKSGVDKSSSGGLLKSSSSGLIISKRKETAPRFISTLEGCIVDQGSTVTLTAIVEGFPTPEVTWARNSGPLLKDCDACYDKGRAVLIMNNVKTQHGGRYSCTATNSVGTATSTADVIVKKSSFPPVMGRRLQARTAVVGERVSLEIEVTGTPTPTVSWSKDGQSIRPTSSVYRFLDQGNSHSLIIDKVDYIHSGQYGAVATNDAGEARSTADLVVIEPPVEAPQPTKLFFSDLVDVGSRALSTTIQTPTKTVSTSSKLPGGGEVVVSESYKSEKHVSMRVEKSSATSIEDFMDLKKTSNRFESVQTRTDKPPAVEIEIPKPTFDKPVEPPKPFIDASSIQMPKPYTAPPTQDTFKTSEDLVTDSISTKSSLDFFKSLIKDSEEECRKINHPPEPRPEFKPWTPKLSQPAVREQYSSSFASFKETKQEITPDPAFLLEPGPPPEMGYIPKAQVSKPREDLADRVKRLEESHRDLSFTEIPSGGIRIFPVKRQTDAPSSPIRTPSTPLLEKKTSFYSWEGKKEIEEKPVHRTTAPVIEPVLSGAILRPSADIQLRPTSPLPSAEGVSMEKLWASSKKEEMYNYSTVTSETSVERPKSPMPSSEGIAMDKLWAHKNQESSITTIWPPLCEQKEREVTVSKSQFTSSTSGTSEILDRPGIIYVAEAQGPFHKTNVLPTSSVDVIKSSHSSFLSERSQSGLEKVRQPSFETSKFSRKHEFKQIKTTQPFVDEIHLEPGPPPEIGYATPPPKERRQSYVELMEQEIEKDLDKEPTRRLVGAVRTIPPPRRETSVDSQKSDVSRKIERRSSSFCDETFKPFPTLEPFPFKADSPKLGPTKYSTVPRPSKFQKKCAESDYESDFEGTKIKSRWTPWDSDNEEPHYRKVKPPSSLQVQRSKSEQPDPYSPVVALTKQTSLISQQSKQYEYRSQQQFYQQSTRTDQSTVQLKPGSPPQFLKADSPKSKKRQTFQDSGYMADTDEPPRISRQKTLMTTAASSQHRVEKSVTSAPIASQTKRPMPSVQSQSKETRSTRTTTFQNLEPFPFKPSPPSPAPIVSVPLPASPSKFVKGEFKESDYESDYESRIPPIWDPSLGKGERTFKPVKPRLSPPLSASITPSGGARAPTPPSQFDTPPLVEGPPRPKFEPIEKPVTISTEKKIFRPQPHYVELKPGSPPKMDYAPPLTAVETSNTMSFTESTASSKRVVNVQKTTRVISFDQKQTSSSGNYVKAENKWLSDSESEMKSTIDVKAEQKRLQRVEEMRKRFGEGSQSLIELTPGEPPQFDYAPPRIAEQASTVASKHMSEMTSTFKSKAQKFVSDVATDIKEKDKKVENEHPQVYREEKRHSEHGTKCIDPDTGLIYFKYDFGYEFGIVLPGEGAKGVAGGKKFRSIETASSSRKHSDREEGAIDFPVIHEAAPTESQKKKKPQTNKSVKWEPTSESEMSDLEEMRKRGGGEPIVTMPLTPTPSPLSISPGISTHSPAHEAQGVGQWKSSSPAPVIVNAMLHTDVPKKPPMFITPLRDIAVVNGQTARFECIVQAEPSPSIGWCKNGHLIQPSITHEIQFRNGVCRLTIPHASSYDAGTYTCTATNSLGTQTTSSSLQVQGEARTFISK